MPVFNANLLAYQVSGANVNGTGFMTSQSAKWTANTGITKVLTANSALDGTGTTATVLTAADSGTYVKSITLLAQTRALQGMVRIFLNDGGTNTFLLTEVEIPPLPKSGATLSGVHLHIGLNFFLKSGYIIKASTELADTYNVIAEGLNLTYP